MGLHGKNLIINNMKLLLIILFGIFASCKVTHVVKCECKGTSYQPFPNFPQEGGIWIGVPDQNFSPNWFHPIGTEPNDTIYISQSVDTMLPTKWIFRGDSAILKSNTYKPLKQSL